MLQQEFLPFTAFGWPADRKTNYIHTAMAKLNLSLPDRSLIIGAGLFVIGKTFYNFIHMQQIHNLEIGLILSSLTGVVIISWVMRCKNGKKNSILF